MILTAQWLVFRRLDAQRIKIEDKREAEVWVEESRLHHRRLSMEQALAYHSDQTPMHVTRERPELQGPRAPILPPLLARSRDERPVSARRGRRTKAALAAIAVIAVFAVIVTVLKLKTSVLDKQHPAAHHPIFFAASGGGDPGKVSTFGLVTAYFCASLYLGSRLPQLHHNYSRGSVQGLSISLFVLATAANICYICSILTSSRAVNQDLEWNTKYLRDAFPFFLTAGGAMAFDQVILAQWICKGIPQCTCPFWLQTISTDSQTSSNSTNRLQGLGAARSPRPSRRRLGSSTTARRARRICHPRRKRRERIIYAPAAQHSSSPERLLAA